MIGEVKISNEGKLLQNDYLTMSKEEEELHREIEKKINLNKPLIS